ncbi:MAG: hypothetical protein IJI74_04185 [Firmicutes bacterium]|nr:hypothetical protein [Bacillota bacterium]
MLKRTKKIGYMVVVVAFAIAMVGFALTGCGSKYNAPAGIVGDWTCRDLASDETTDTSFYKLTVSEDGSFSLYDYASGNPGISGNMYCDDTGNLGIINIECDSADFDPPFCWQSLSQNARLRYKVISSDTIKLGYVGVWLIFDRSTEEESDE